MNIDLNKFKVLIGKKIIGLRVTEHIFSIEYLTPKGEEFEVDELGVNRRCKVEALTIEIDHDRFQINDDGCFSFFGKVVRSVQSEKHVCFKEIQICNNANLSKLILTFWRT